jgi:hypothetical protein
MKIIKKFEDYLSPINIEILPSTTIRQLEKINAKTITDLILINQAKNEELITLQNVESEEIKNTRKETISNYPRK